jgi:hypothetical protein
MTGWFETGRKVSLRILSDAGDLMGFGSYGTFRLARYKYWSSIRFTLMRASADKARQAFAQKSSPPRKARTITFWWG